MATKKLDITEVMYLARLIGQEKASVEQTLAMAEQHHLTSSLQNAKENLMRLDNISNKLIKSGLLGEEYYIKCFKDDMTHHYNWAIAHLHGETVNA